MTLFLMALTVFGVIGFFYLCFFKIEEGHRGVLLRFGKRLEMLYGPGVHSKRPWDKVFLFSIMEKRLDLGKPDQPFQTFLKDGTAISVFASVRFKMKEAESDRFLFEVDSITQHLKELFECLLRNEIAQFKNFSEIRKNREQLNIQIQRSLNQEVGDRYGIQFLSLDVREIVPPVELMDALNSYQKATAEIETEFSRVFADCETRIEAANHGVEIARKKAEASEIDIITLKQALEKLHSQGVLGSYLDRRRDEVKSASKTIYYNS